MKRIQITSDQISVIAELDQSETAARIWDTLPIEGSVNRWGEEIYFSIPVKIDQSQDAREEVDSGDLGYWAPGRAFCIFFGPTPASVDERPRAASPVNLFGRIQGDAGICSQIPDGASIRVMRADKD